MAGYNNWPALFFPLYILINPKSNTMKFLHHKTTLACIFIIFAQQLLLPVAVTAHVKRSSKAAKATTGWTADKQLVLNLYGLSTGNTESLADGLRVRYNDGFLASTADDIVKMMNFGENISSYRENTDLVIERRPLVISNDTVFLHFTNANIHDYRFKINTVNFQGTGLAAYLQDSYTASSRMINMDGSINNFDFSVTADPASANPFRFRIVFGAPAILPVTISSFKAAMQGKQVLLNWQVSNQLNMQYYEVERSNDGVHYSGRNRQAVSGNNGSTAQYSWIDGNPETGNNYYRIRCVGIGGEITNSTVINIKTGISLPGISIYPNPVTNNTIALQFTGMPKGDYQLQLLNSHGQVLLSKLISHSGANNAQTVFLGAGISKGSYYLEIKGPADLTLVKILAVE